MIATEKLQNIKSQANMEKKKNPRILFDPSENETACEKISYILNNLGITPNLTGYKYLRYAIEVSLLDENSYSMIATYEKIAEFTGKPCNAIYHSMRFAINRMEITKSDLKYKLFPYTFKIHDEKFHITNVEFVETIADYLRYHY